MPSDRGSVVVAVREHLPQISDVGGGLVRRQIGAGDCLGFRETALQADHEREVLPHPRIDRWLRRRAAQSRLGFAQILGQRIREPKIRKHRGLVRNDLQRRQVIALRFGMAAHLVEHGALRRQDVPVGLIRRMCALKHFERLLVIAGFRQRAPVGAEHGFVVRVFDRSPLKYGDRLGALSGCAQRLGISHRQVEFAGLARYFSSVDFNIVPPIGIRNDPAGRQTLLEASRSFRSICVVWHPAVATAMEGEKGGRGRAGERSGYWSYRSERISIAAKIGTMAPERAAAADRSAIER